MKNSIYYLAVILSFVSSSIYASSIEGEIRDDKDDAVYYANIILFNLADSALVDLHYSDEKGQFKFDNIKPGSYWLECRYVGFPDYITEAFKLEEGSELSMGVMNFSAPANALDEVTISAQKPMLEMKPDKIVLNVEGSINAAGSDAFTLLRRSPGVVIDNSDNIFMLGKGGVQIYIDGKPSPLNGTDLVEYLKTIPSSEIESIEIISHPSSRYEAEGNAGIINIKFRKDKNLGTSGNINASSAVGLRHANNITGRLTNRSKHFNSFISLSGYEGEGVNPFSLYREQSGLVFDQNSIAEDEYRGFNYRAGTDIYLGDKHTIGLLWMGSASSGSGDQNSRTEISMVGSSVIDSILSASNFSDWNRDNNNYNINYRFDEGNGRSLNIDLDYGIFNSDGFDDQPNTYLKAGSLDTLAVKNFANELPNRIRIASIKIDYEQNLWNGNLGAGLKLSRVLTENTFNFYNVIDGERLLDEARSNSFSYDEDVNAAYVNYSRKLGELSLNAGLRVEHTHSLGELEAMVPGEDESVDRDYVDFFPSFGASWKLNEKNSFQLSYSRRLNRPSYRDLNPFRQRLDELTFEQGNPFLNPEYASSVQVSHNWNYKLTTSISYSHTADMIARLTDAEDERFAYITWRNIADQHTYSISISAPIPITSWWNSYTNISGTRTENSSDFGEGKRIDITANTFSIYGQHNFKLPGGYGMELSGWYNSPAIWEGNFKMRAMYAIDFGVQKSFMDDNLDLRLSISDIFKTQRWQGVTRFGGQFIDAAGSWDSRRVRLNLSYRFGNSNVKVRKRQIGLEDEKNRIKTDG